MDKLRSNLAWRFWGSAYAHTKRYDLYLGTLPRHIFNFNNLLTSQAYHDAYDNILDSYSKRMSQKWYQLFINEELKKLIYFFTCILPYYVTHEITKEFWKASYFENMTAGFLLWVKKHFGKIPLKRCIFNNEIFHFHQYWPCNSYCSH